MKRQIITIISNRNIIVIVFIVIAIIASVSLLMRGMTTFYNGSPEYKQYNNYIIFQKSYEHLDENKDLYILYPEEYWDLYKYSPTFSAFFGLFSFFPDYLGLVFWNLLNAMVLIFGIYYLPKINNYQKGILSLIILLELITSMQNSQSNGLMVGLIVFAFGLLEKDKYAIATFLLVFSIFIKLFGIVGFALFLFYPKKWKLALYSIFWSIILLIIPLIFIDLESYKNLLLSYSKMLNSDLSTSYGYSVMGWLNSWFSININKIYILTLGVVIFLIPYIRYKIYKNYLFRLLGLSSILIWVVIFNPKAESPTFIIAATGAALWFVISKFNILNTALIFSFIIFTSLSFTDAFPSFIRHNYIMPFAIKAIPVIIIWIKIIYDMTTMSLNDDVDISSE